MWAAILLAPVSAGMAAFGSFVAQATGAPSSWGEMLAPLGAAAPFAALAVYVIRRQETVVDKLTAELQRVNGLAIDRVVPAVNDAVNLHRDTTRVLEQVLAELRRPER